jgi:small subunit ribosomal protein S27Ae
MAGKVETKEKKIAKSRQYDVSSGVLRRKGKFCPKCGAGVFMAAHKDRYACGKCGFAESNKK